MLNPFEFLAEFEFARNALAVSIMIALCASLFGVTLVLKRFSFIGDGLSHAAFGALALAAVLQVSNELVVVLPITVVMAILLLKAGNNTKIKGDAAVAMVSVGALAIGYLLLNVFSVSGNVAGDVCASLFGATSILTLSETDVVLCMVMSTIVIILFVLFYNRIFAVTFDESFASATGVKTEVYNMVIAVVTAVIIVIAMKLVGSLIVSALIIFPALSAMRIFKSFRGVTVCAAVVSVVCATMGFFGSLVWGLPVGPAIVAVNIICFICFFCIGKVTGR